MPIGMGGVVKVLKFGLPSGRKIQVFYPYRQRISYVRSMCFVVRSTGNPLSIATRVRQELRDLDPNLPVLKIDTIEEQLNDVLMQERLRATLSSFFGVLAVLLAGLGIFGVISYAVSRRTNEIGIRLALGAKPSNVQLMVLKETLLLTLVGVAIGVPVTLAATRLISTKLFGVSASDPVTIFGATVLMISVGALAALLPAHRASRVDPLVALRYE